MPLSITNFINSVKPTLATIPSGEIFDYGGRVYMKVHPTQSMFHSKMVTDVINRGDCFVVNLQTGTLTILQGNSSVVHYPHPQINLTSQ